MSYFSPNESIASTANATTTPLSGGATFTGTGELNNFAGVLVQSKSDVAGTLYMEFSLDGTNWDSSLSFECAAGVPEIHRLEKGARYFRVRYVNGAAAQTYFRLGVVFGPFGPLTAPYNLPLGLDADSLFIRMGDPLLDEARGLLSGIDSVLKFGKNENVGGTEEDVWYGGGLITWLQAADTVRIKSLGNVADDAAGSGCRTLRVYGLDENWELAEEDITTAGNAASSSTSTTFIRIYRAKCLTSGTYHGNNVGNIVIETTGGVEMTHIPAGYGQTVHGAYTIPAGYTGYVKKWGGAIGSSKFGELYLRKMENADTTSAPYTAPALIDSEDGLTGDFRREFATYNVVPEKTDVWLAAKAAASGTVVSGFFDIKLVKN